MIFKTTELIAEEFREAGIACGIYETDDFSAVEFWFNTNIGRHIFIRFITERDPGENKNNVLVRAFNFTDAVPENRINAVMRACIQMNNNFNYVSFSINSKNEVYASSWLPDSTPDDIVGTCCRELLARIGFVMEKATPAFAEAIYSKEKEKSAPNATNVVKALNEALTSLRENPIVVNVDEAKKEKSGGEQPEESKA